MGDRDLRHNGDGLLGRDGDHDVRVHRAGHDQYFHDLFNFYYFHDFHNFFSLHDIHYVKHINYTLNHDDHSVNHYHNCSRINNHRTRTPHHSNEYYDCTTFPSDKHADHDLYHDHDTDDFLRARVGVRSDGRPPAARAGDRLRRHEAVGQTGLKQVTHSEN